MRAKSTVRYDLVAVRRFHVIFFTLLLIELRSRLHGAAAQY